MPRIIDADNTVYNDKKYPGNKRNYDIENFNIACDALYSEKKKKTKLVIKNK